MARPFRLARVLRVRTRLREQAQDEVRRVHGRLAALTDAIAAARAAHAATRAAEEAAGASGLSGEELCRWRAYEAALVAEEAALVAARDEVARELARGREVLVGRRREERQLERLRERSAAREEAAEERGTMVLLDDLALRSRGERR